MSDQEMRDLFFGWPRVRREVHKTLKALAGGWPGLVFFLLVMVVAFMMEGR